MNISISEREELWDKFLQRWPLESLDKVTLRDYTLAGDADCFTYGWLEQTTEELGSIWGGSAFKFGIYSRKDQSAKDSSAGRSYSTEYGWYSKYGSTPEEAFEQVREIIVAIAHAARTGNLDAIQQADLGSAIKWKIAFLYQDRTAPSILPVYSAEHLATYLEQQSKRNIAKLQADVMSQRGERNVFSFGQKVWEQSQEKLSAMILKAADVLAFFQEYPERFQPIKSPTKYIAGFTTTEGRNLAISLESKKAQLWMEPGTWLDGVKTQLKDIELYESERSRSSNLSANAPKLAQGNPAVFLTVPTRAALLALCDAYDNTDIFESKPMSADTRNPSFIKDPLNQILYGPPGTGKTFSAIDETLRILDPDFLSKHKDDRKALKAQFDLFAKSEHVRFVTFHQSFSYEDFVEGLRAITNDDKQLEYVVEPGVFKRLCDDAITQGAQPAAGIRNNPRIWKISINSAGASTTQSYCLNNGEARIGWGSTGDLAEPYSANTYYNGIGPGDRGTLRYFSEEIVPGDILLCIHSAEMIGAVGVVTGDYKYDDTVHQGVREDYQHVRPVNWLYRDLQLPIAPLNDGKQFTLKTVYSMDRFSWGDLLAYLEKSGAVPRQPSITAAERTPHVLIIDEINRGNISRIFGELITLIEPSKRAGADEALSVTLPYSKKPFSVPSNVFLIGTMNTADRSLAGLDIALRRRFTFKEMPARPELLDGLMVEGIDIGQLLRIMNQRIEVLLDRDHCLGHAYFMPLKDESTLEDLALIFRNQILPLLQEYFFEDWQRIQWVLNDHRKNANDRFVYQDERNIESLFGKDANASSNNLPWMINKEAFDRPEAYLRIVDHEALENESKATREATYPPYLIRQMPSGSIDVLLEGQRQSPALPHLRKLAEELDVMHIYDHGGPLNTRELGRKLIIEIEASKP